MRRMRLSEYKNVVFCDPETYQAPDAMSKRSQKIEGKENLPV